MIGYASQALSKSEYHYLAIELLALKWAIMESFQEYLHGNTFASYSNINPLMYVLMMGRLDATRQRWMAKLTKLNFTIYYHSSKSNMDVDALFLIPWDKNIKAEVAKAIFKATVEGPDALMEVYAYNEGL